MGHMSQHRVTRDTSGLELQTNVHTKVGNHGDEPSCGPPFETLLVTPRDTWLVTTMVSPVPAYWDSSFHSISRRLHPR